MKEKSPIADCVQEAEEYLRQNYPSKRSWVEKNLEVLKSFGERQTPMLDYEIVSHAIKTTRDFAERGIDPEDKHCTDVIHIPSRLAAIRKFEKDIHPLRRQLSLDGVVQILVVAETANVRRSIQYASSDKVQHYLDNLTNLVKIHKELTGL